MSVSKSKIENKNMKKADTEQYRTLSIIASDSFIARIDKVRGYETKSAFMKKAVEDRIKRLENRQEKKKQKGQLE